MDVYAPQGVIFYGIEQSGYLSGAKSYLQRFGWTFPNGFANANTAGSGNPFATYGTDRHNYFVIDTQGRIVHRSNDTAAYAYTFWDSIKPGLVAAIDAALAVPVETTTWSRVKVLYR